MFTGIIQEIGRIDTKRRVPEGFTFTASAQEIAGRLSAGDSVAVNGVCQTVEAVEADRFTFTAVGETLKRTTLGSIRDKSPVNLESAATPDTALGGHLVQGHVDGVGTVDSFRQSGKDRLLAVRMPEEVGHLVVPKGSITIDGVSLTIIDVRPGAVVTITIVPFTIEKTIVQSYRRGTRVNVEADIIGKYVLEYLMKMQGGGLGGRVDSRESNNFKR